MKSSVTLNTNFRMVFWHCTTAVGMTLYVMACRIRLINVLPASISTNISLFCTFCLTL